MSSPPLSGVPTPGIGGCVGICGTGTTGPAAVLFFKISHMKNAPTTPASHSSRSFSFTRSRAQFGCPCGAHPCIPGVPVGPRM